jgi:hypothetical protein
MAASQKNQDDQYSDEEAQRRFEAALRGAREVGHESMKDIPPKRSKPSEMELWKSKAKSGAEASRPKKRKELPPSK